MKALRISFAIALAFALAVCVSCDSRHTMATIPAGPQVTPLAAPVSPGVPQLGKAH